MNLRSVWVDFGLVALIPITSALIILYSDVQTLKVVKADNDKVLELKVEFTKQMTRNTTAIENLNETLKSMKEHMYEQPELSLRR